jgi:hypothetical protein
MADNTTTYKAVIETEVVGQGEVDNLKNSTEQAGQGFKSLRSQIRETTQQLQALEAEGKTTSKEFQDLRSTLDELNDAQDRVNFQAGQFDDQLSALPGPLGQVGGAIQSFNEGLNRFSTGFKVALGVVGLIVGAFLALKESLERTEEGQEKLNRITEGFTKIMNGLFAIIEPIAMALADLVIGLLENEKVMDGLSKTVGVLSGVFTGLFGILKEVGGFVINVLVNNFKTLIGVAKGAGDVIAGVFTFDFDRIKKGADAAFKAVKEGVTNQVKNVKDLATGVTEAVVDGYKAGEEGFKKGFSRLTEKQKEAQKKSAEERKKLQEEAEKVQTEAYLALLDGRQKELTQRETKYQEDLKKLKAAGIKDFTNLDEAYRKDVAAINKKYDDEAIKKQEEALNKQREKLEKESDLRLKVLSSETKLIDAEYQNRVQLINQEEQELLSQVGLTEEEISKIRESASQKRLDAESDRFQTRLQNINEEENILLQKLNDTEALLLQNQQLTDEERLNIQKDFEAQRTDVIVNASTQRQGVRDVETQNELLALDNRFQEILTSEADNYNALVAVVDEKEKLLLSNTQLTEEERTRIQQEAANQRAGIRAKETSDQLALIDTELNNIATSFDRKRELVNQREQELLQQEGLTEAQRTQIRQQGADERAAIDAAELDARAQIQSAYIDLVGQLGSTLQAIAGKNKKVAIAGVVIEQAAAIAKIVQNTAIANAKSVAALPLTGGQPFVAINTISAGLSIVSSIAAGLKAVQQIRNADSGNISGGGSIPRASAGLRAAGVEQTGVPTILGTEGANPQTQVAATIQRASQNQRPVRAYVVSQDISSTQALDRRTNTAATFG